MTMRGSLFSLVLALPCSFGLVCAVAAAQPTEPEGEVEAAIEPPATVPAPTPSKSRSIGTTNRGRLDHGVQVQESEFVRVKRRGEAGRYGTAEFVAALAESASHVAALHPGSKLFIGDISRRRGRRFRPHRSHRAGRDADIGYYLLDEAGEPAEAPRFLHLGRQGTAVFREVSYRFDDVRNWAFVAHLLSSERVQVQFIFLYGPLRRRLLEEAARVGAPAELIERASQVMRQPSRGAPHRSHMHIRIYCAEDDRPRCRDGAPYWDWIRRNRRPR